MTWLLHSFAFTMDADESWRLKGEEGMAKQFAPATKEFIGPCRSVEGLKVSSELE